MSGVWVERPHQLPDGYVPPSASLTPPTTGRDVVAEHPLIAFLRARWDEESTELDEMLSGALVQGYLRHHGGRLKADIAAKREILMRYERAVVAPKSSLSSFVRGQDDGFRQACVEALKLLALPYADHPDYREEWRP